MKYMADFVEDLIEMWQNLLPAVRYQIFLDQKLQKNGLVSHLDRVVRFQYLPRKRMAYGGYTTMPFQLHVLLDIVSNFSLDDLSPKCEPLD